MSTRLGDRILKVDHAGEHGAVVLGAANVTGGYVVTERILQMFDRSNKKQKAEAKK